jgi:FixJ family two-component response regulator
MMSNQPLRGEARQPANGVSQVYVIDDDEALRCALSGLLRSVGLEVETYAASAGFLAAARAGIPSCLILDMRLRCENGFEVQDAMERHNLHMPVVFITGYGDIKMTVKAMKAGAADFLAKPFRDQDLLDAVGRALERDRKRLAHENALAALRCCYESLTPREREVLALVTVGLLNKQIASELQVSEVTVKMHRAQAMKKMAARSVADLMAKVDRLGVRPGHAQGTQVDRNRRAL